MKSRISTDARETANPETREKTGGKRTALFKAFVFIFCVACATLIFGVGTARAANHSMGQLDGGTGTYSDGNTILFGKNQTALYGKTFTAPPVVVVNARDASGNPLAAAADGVTATGFTLKVCDLDGNAASNATVQWLAIIPDPNNPKVKAGNRDSYDGEDVIVNPAFDMPYPNSYPIVLCSAYGAGDDNIPRPLLATFQNLRKNGFAAILKDVYGTRAEGSFSWIAIEITQNLDYLYDEAVLIGNYSTRYNGQEIAYGPPISTYAQSGSLLALTCGQKEGAAYCTSSRNISLNGFYLGLQGYDGNSTTNVWTSWLVLGLNPPGTHIVTFEKNGGDEYLDKMYFYTDGSNPVTPPSAKSRSGYHFAEWNTQSDGHGSTFTTSTAVTEDITAYAIWTPNTCNVTFDENGGKTEANPKTKTVTNPATTVGTLPTPPTRDGYTFAGWNTKKDGTGYAFNASTVLTANPTNVYAMWTPDTYTVTFDKNGGDTDASPTTKTVTTPATTVDSLPTPPTRNGYHFAGWNTQSNGLGSALTTSTAVTGNMPVYAMWTPIYTVTFDKNNGGTEASPTSATTDINMHVTLPATNPMRSGYHFAGWNTKADGSGAAFTGSAVVTVDIRVYAMWKPIYTVTFDKNGGNEEASPIFATTDINGYVTLPTANPTRSGYHFTGWNTKADGSGTAFTASAAVTGDITVFAVWERNTYTVTFDSNGGDTDANPRTAATDANGHAALPAPPARTGYEFTGWNTKPDGSGVNFTSSEVVDSDMTVYAQWRKIKAVYTVKFNTSGGTPVQDIIADEGTVVTDAPSTSRTGYVFEGWCTDAGLSRPAAFPYTVAGDATLYAKWIRIYKADKLPSTVTAGTKIAITSSSPPKGYTFKTIKCSSGDKKIATVDGNGIAAFLKGGKVKLTIKMVFAKSGATKPVTIAKQITVKQLVSSVTLNKTKASLKPKKTLKLVPKLAPSTATNKKVSWKSSNTKVAAVSAKGVVTAKKKGTAVITCTAQDGSKATAACTVTVN
jgi:uncharacterized repeat protein (TIGR02543 family)